MAWTAPMTAVSGNAFTAAQFNTHIRDNLLETAPAKATSAGGLIVTTGANAVTQRTPQAAHIATAESTTSTSYVDLSTVGPSVTVSCGSTVLISIYSSLQCVTASALPHMSYAISGSTTVSATDATAVSFQNATAGQSARIGMTFLRTGMTPGSNTFTAKYKTSSGTGSFADRRITVVPL